MYLLYISSYWLRVCEKSNEIKINIKSVLCKIHIKEYHAVKSNVNIKWIIRGWFIFGYNFNVLYYGASIQRMLYTIIFMD